MQKITTLRLPVELDKRLTEYAKEKELSKNQVVKMAIRQWLYDLHDKRVG